MRNNYLKYFYIIIGIVSFDILHAWYNERLSQEIQITILLLRQGLICIFVGILGILAVIFKYILLKIRVHITVGNLSIFIIPLFLNFLTINTHNPLIFESTIYSCTIIYFYLCWLELFKK